MTEQDDCVAVPDSKNKFNFEIEEDDEDEDEEMTLDICESSDNDHNALVLDSVPCYSENVGSSSLQSRLFPCMPASIQHELYAMLKLAWPVVLSTLLQMLCSVVLVIFVGHYMETIALDVVGLGVSFGNVFGISIGQGLASASDTLSSQAWGSSNKKAVGVILQRGIAILGLACMLTACLWINAESVLIILKQDPQAQNIVHPLFYVGIIANVANLIFCGLFIVYFRLDIAGAAVTQVLTYMVFCGSLAGYIYFSGVYRASWPGWTTAALLGWKAYLRLAIPGVLMLCIEWWSFEISQFLAGVMGPVPLAAQLIVLQFGAFSFMIPLGVGIAASVRIGNLLGSNNPNQAKKTAIVALGIISCTASTTAILFFSLRHVLPRAFTNDEEVISKTATILTLLGIFTLFDHGQGVYAGILRGCGLQKFGAIFNVLGYYVIGIPVMVILAFVLHMGVAGLWYGLVSAVFVQVLAYTVLLFFRTDWNKQALIAVQRSRGAHVGKDVTKVNSQNYVNIQQDDDVYNDDHQHSQIHRISPTVDQHDICNSNGHVCEVKFSGKQSFHLEEKSVPNGNYSKDSNSTDFLDHDADDGDDMSSLLFADKQILHKEMNQDSLPNSKSLPADIKWKRIACVAGVGMILVASIIARATIPSTAVCYPLPDIANATSVCNSFTSVLAGHTCKVRCKDGFLSMGVFRCSVNGTLLEQPECIISA